MVEGAFGSQIYDILIIGAGPAGLSAAVNAKARNMDAVVVDFREPVTKVRTYPEVTNYLGFSRASGAELANHFAQHFSHTGYPFRKERALKIVPGDDVFVISTDKGIYESRAVIITTGVAQKKVLPGEEQLLGRGLSYCVTCDGALYRGKDVVVVGYIPEGEEEANALAAFARKVTYVATYQNVETIEEPVEVLHAVPIAVEGDVRVRGLKTSAGDIEADGIFIIREAIPASTLVDGLAVADGFIKVDKTMATSVPGLFAAGDCTGPPFQIGKSVGEGQIAALSATRYVHTSRKKES